jgi:hypothetical protein
LIEQQEGCRVIDNLKDSSKDVGLKWQKMKHRATVQHPVPRITEELTEK